MNAPRVAIASSSEGHVNKRASFRRDLVTFLGGVNPWLVALNVLMLWVLLLYILAKKGWLAGSALSLFGPALMVKTQRGRGLLDWFARAPRFFDGFATLGLWLTVLFMFLMTALLLVQLPFILRIPPEAAPDARLILGIPGINPIIPIGYGIVALIVAVVVHEFSHGIMARVYQLRVKTMGLLFLIIPVGAFVEPDEDELKAASRRNRLRVFSAGPASNLALAILFAVLFSSVLISAAEPVEGVPIVGLELDGPACEGGLLPGWVLTGVDLNSTGDRANATPLRSRTDFTTALNSTRPNQTITFYVAEARIPSGLSSHACVNETNLAMAAFPVRTRACQELYTEDANASCNPNDETRWDVMNRSVIGIRTYDVGAIQGVLARPLESGGALLYYVGLPFYALRGEFPLAEPFQDYYATPFHAPTFWVLANTFYWLFWINLMLGLTNALPLVPLDGGHMFKDLIGGWLHRASPTMSAERRDGIARRISTVMALLILGLILAQFLAPMIRGWFV